MSSRELAASFMDAHGQSAACIDTRRALEILAGEMDAGLRGTGGLPMLPAYIDPARLPEHPRSCIAMDIGGTNLRRAEVFYGADGTQQLRNVRERPLAQLGCSLTEEEFFEGVTAFSGVREAELPLAVSYSYNMESLPGPDGRMLGWCKELRICQMTGATVAQAIRRAAGQADLPVWVVNDSVAAMLGCPQRADIGIIVGTGFNICAQLPCRDILKLAGSRQGRMVVNTEVGESRAFEAGDFERAVIAASEDPQAAWAEKQVAGRYLEQTIRLALSRARAEGLPVEPGLEEWDLARLGQLGEDSLAGCIVAQAVRRSARIAAICLHALLRRGGHSGPAVIGAEGSVLLKMPGYRQQVQRELAGQEGCEPAFTGADFAGIRGAARMAE